MGSRVHPANQPHTYTTATADADYGGYPGDLHDGQVLGGARLGLPVIQNLGSREAWLRLTAGHQVRTPIHRLISITGLMNGRDTRVAMTQDDEACTPGCRGAGPR